MFEQFAKHYTLQQLNQFQKAMNIMRKNAKTKKQKINAINKQINYFNLIYKDNNVKSNIKQNHKFLLPNSVENLTVQQINKLWNTFKPKHMKSKKAHSVYYNNFVNNLYFLDFFVTESEAPIQYQPGYVPPAVGPPAGPPGGGGGE